MTFVVRMLTAPEERREAFQACEALVAGKINLGYPLASLVDEDRKYSLFSFGGRGEMPAITGAPPYQYILGINSKAYYYALRSGQRVLKDGGILRAFIIEDFRCIVGDENDYSQVDKVMEEAIFVSLINTGWARGPRSLEGVVLIR